MSWEDPTEEERKRMEGWYWDDDARVWRMHPGIANNPKGCSMQIIAIVVVCLGSPAILIAIFLWISSLF